MRVRLFGVSLSVAPALTLAGLFDHLKTVRDEVFPYRGLDRMIYADAVGDFHVALFLTIRDHRITMELQEEGGRLVVKPKEIEEGKQAIDYNLLAVHKVTGRGVYQHYRNSLWINSMGGILSHRHDDAVRLLRDAWLAANGKTRANTQEAAKKFAGGMSVAQMVREDELETLVKELDRVSAVSLDFEGIRDRSKAFQPFSNYVETSRYRMKFKAKLSGKSIAASLMNLIDTQKPKGGKIEGVEDGVRRTLDILEELPTIFGEFDFDTVAAEFVPDEFTEFSMLTRMIGAMKADPSTFTRPAK